METGNSSSMARYLSRVARALIVSLLGFGGGVGLLVFIVTLVIGGDRQAFQHGLVAGVIIGATFAVLLVSIQILTDATFHLFLTQGRSYEQIWELAQTRELEFPGTFKEALHACRQSLLAVPNVSTVTEDTERLIVKASVGSSWRSPGELVEVELEPVAEESWKIKCFSRPLSNAVVFDYGKNFENVESWFKQMTKFISGERGSGDSRV